MRSNLSILAMALALPQSACAAAEGERLPADDTQEIDKVQQGAGDDMTADEPEGVASLPYARGRTFATLDAYLLYLEQYNGPVDMPWWREIAPGVYRQEIRMAGGPEPEVATRAELLERFGFPAEE